MEPLIAARTKQATALSPGTINGHAYVDLGLSVKWATCNVGAASPEDYGDYYAWGETSTKASYTEVNSKTYGKSGYNRDIGGDTSLDAARAHWGGTWRLPTEAEAQELVEKCTWEWVAQGEKSGCKVTGPSGKSIFLPAAGHRDGSSLDDIGENGLCWTSSPHEEGTANAWGLFFIRQRSCMGWGYRYFGFSVRPVSG